MSYHGDTYASEPPRRTLIHLPSKSTNMPKYKESSNKGEWYEMDAVEHDAMTFYLVTCALLCLYGVLPLTITLEAKGENIL